MSEHVVRDQTATVTAMTGSARPPTFISRFFKLPLVFYRAGLGWVFGTHFMRLKHVGRRSGKVYEAVLAVLRFDPRTLEISVVSPWSSSNWFRNIQATPAVEVATGSIQYAPEQRTLSPEEIAQLFIEFRGKHPLFSRMVARIPHWKIDSSYEQFVELARGLRGVEFRPGR